MLHQATCVAVAGRGILIEGAPGSGKSSLALALIDRGAVLVGDDGVLLRREGARLIARPAPATAGLLEVRNVGVLPYPCVAEAAVALLVRLDPGAPRFIEEAASVDLSGVAVPMVQLFPDSPVLALRALAALERYGSG